MVILLVRWEKREFLFQNKGRKRLSERYMDYLMKRTELEK